MPSLQPTRRKVLGRWRRWFFHLWTGATIAALAFIAILDPVVLSGNLDKAVVAAFVPPLMILLTLFGVGWLVLLMLSRQRRNDNRRTNPGGDPAAASRQ